MAKKIFFGNYKGGVGKTTSAFYLAKQFGDVLSESGRVLILDLDPQCSMSEICVRSFDQKKTLSDIESCETINYMIDMLLKSKKYNTSFSFDFSKIIKNCKNMSSNVDFIPASMLYHDKGNIFNGLDGLIEYLQFDSDNNIFIIHNIVNLLEDRYDYIFFDCPPSNNMLTKSAFLTSDYYIIPYIADNISVKGVEHYIDTVDNIYDKYCNEHPDSNFYKLVFGDKPILLGVFECMRIRNENPRGNIGTVKVKRYNTVIKNLIGIQEELSKGRTSNEIGAYASLAQEIVKDLGEYDDQNTNK